MDRDCNNCVYSTRDGNCRKWNCEGTKTVEDIRKEVIDEISNKSFCEFTNCEDCAMWGQYDEFGEEEVCFLEQIKEQK